MPTCAVLAAFALTVFAATLVPGPTVTYVVARSLEGGRLAGLTAALGVAVGALTHALAAAAGLASVLASTPWAFTTIQLVGAGYLVHLGIRQLRGSRPGPRHASRRTPTTRRLRVFIDGIVVDILNPKTVLFFVAILPPFIDPARGTPGIQLMVLALCYVPITWAVCSAYALLAARVSAGLSGGPSARNRVNRSTALVYFGIAAFAVLA